MFALGRSATLVAMAAGAVGIPYMVSESATSHTHDAAHVEHFDLHEEHAAAPAGAAVHPEAAPAHPAVVQTPTAPLTGHLSGDLMEPFRFEITPDWVIRRWQRVSTISNQSDLQGYRVPLVTGTNEHDLAGSLTYFFDRDKKLQRIVFHGSTGNAVPLTQRLAKMYGFKREASPDPGLYLFRVRWNGKPVSELQLRPSTVVEAGSPHARIEVHLLIERPAKLDVFSGNHDGRRYDVNL
jgi:hypothetical protein